MSFGWSAGDIANVVKIVYNAYQALDSYQGAAKEYREAVSFLKRLTWTLEPLKTLTALETYPEYGEDIKEQVNLIKGPVDEFSRIVRKYEPSLGAGARSGRHQHISLKLKYHYLIHKKVLVLRSKIESHMRVLDSILQRLTLDVVYTTQQRLPQSLRSALHETVFPDFKTTIENPLARGSHHQTGMSLERYENLLLRINDIAAESKAMQRRIETSLNSERHPARLIKLTQLLEQPDSGSTDVQSAETSPSSHHVVAEASGVDVGESLSDVYYLVLLYLGHFLKNCFLLLSRLVQPSRQLVPTLIAKFNLTFLDAVGSPSRVLPYEYFRNFKVFQVFVQEEFKGVPLIDRGQYLLLSMTNNHILDERNWRRCIAPGSTVTMSALVHTRQELDFSSARDSQMELCPEPSCKGTWIKSKAQTWVTCPECGRELLGAESRTLGRDSRDDDSVMNGEDISIFKRIVHRLGGRLDGLQCSHCLSTFLRASELKRHLMRHTKPVKCSVLGCNMSFAWHRDLHRHQRSMHPSEYVPVRFQCQVSGCDKSFTRKDNIAKHMRFAHRGGI